MATITLKILNPTHHALIIGGAAAAVNLRGQVVHPAPETLFYKWYSSLNNPAGISGPADAPKAALNWPNHGQAALQFTTALKVGSHILSLTAKDVEGDSLADMQNVTEAGLAGGPEVEGAPAPCLAHVLVAVMLRPPPANLSKSNALLEAEAPLKWAEADYQVINRIRYRWRFEPPGGGTAVAALPPLGASEAAIAAFQQQLQFGPPDGSHSVTFVRYQGPLPGVLIVGNQYNLILRVEDTAAPHTGDEVSRLVSITA